MTSPAGPRIGEYELLRMLGRGGMAEVWLARRRGPGAFERKVVIKRILPQHVHDVAFVKMFVAEARLSARLSHPNIVAVHELGETAGSYYIVMEYVRGPDLRGFLLKLYEHGSAEPGVGAFVVRELARALAYAHDVTDDEGRRLRLIHRDVSPSNIVISFDGSVKLVDFGIAKALDEVNDEQTRSGSFKGKVGYMAPEQLGAASAGIDHRADLWAAGVVLWETITQRRLFRGQNEVHTIDLVRSGPIAKPSEHNASVSPELDRIALKALSRDVDARYQSGNELADDLDRVLADLRFGASEMARTIRERFEGEMDAYSGRVPKVEVEATGDASWTSDGPTPIVTVTPDSAARPSSAAPAVAPTRSTRRFVTAGAAVALVAVAAAATLLGHTRRPPTEVVVRPTVQAPAAPASVTLRVDSTPRGALIFVGSEVAPRGETPIDLVFKKGTERAEVHAEHPGYVSSREDYVPDHDDHMYFSLAPRTAEARPAPKRKK